MLPKICVLICTYNRPREIKETVQALAQNLIYPEDKLQWVICDDASPGSYIEDLKHDPFISSLKPQFVIQRQNGGWGRNVNNGLRYCFASGTYTFFTEDDYVLTRPLDLKAGIALMRSNDAIGMVRYRATSGIPLTYHQKEADISEDYPDYLEHHGYVPGKLTYLELDPASPTLWIYSNGPHLKSRFFHEYYGYYPQGEKLGKTEEMFAHQVHDLQVRGGPSIVVQPEWIYMHWRHIGVSYQYTEADVAR